MTTFTLLLLAALFGSSIAWRYSLMDKLDDGKDVCECDCNCAPKVNVLRAYPDYPDYQGEVTEQCGTYRLLLEFFCYKQIFNTDFMNPESICDDDGFSLAMISTGVFLDAIEALDLEQNEFFVDMASDTGTDIPIINSETPDLDCLTLYDVEGVYQYEWVSCSEFKTALCIKFVAGM